MFDLLFVFLLQLYELNDDAGRKAFLDELFDFMQKRGKNLTDFLLLFHLSTACLFVCFLIIVIIIVVIRKKQSCTEKVVE